MKLIPFKRFKKRKSESGRTTVKILALLAITGILGIGTFLGIKETSNGIDSRINASLGRTFTKPAHAEGWTPPWNICDKHADGERFCSGNTILYCQNGSSRVDTYCDFTKKTCENATCVCLRTTCNDERTVNPETCACECPPDKPLWTGSECKKEGCETVDDCLHWYKSQDAGCFQCVNGSCSVKPTYCENSKWVRECVDDGSQQPITRMIGCEENQKCENGECVCDNKDLCTPGEKECDGDVLRTCVEEANGCPRWMEQDCAETGFVNEKPGKCEDGRCKFHDCEEGEKRCDPDNKFFIQTCNEHGLWNSSDGNGHVNSCAPCGECSGGECVDRTDLSDTELKKCKCAEKGQAYIPSLDKCCEYGENGFASDCNGECCTGLCVDKECCTKSQEECNCKGTWCEDCTE